MTALTGTHDSNMNEQTIGRYRILGEIGAGNMGVVYKALDPMDRVVAVKTMSARIDTNPHLRERFFREARAAAQLSHRNIITIFYMDEDGGKAYLAMEFLDGRDLKAIVSDREPLTLEQRIDIMAQVCAGLSHAHGRGVIHRDIKPSNLFITRSGDVKILDFGLARIVTSEFTASSESMGTPGYMSPEQLQTSKVDQRSDIYSVGAVFYELLTHAKAFEADSLPALFFKIIHADPEPVDKHDPRIPSELSALIRRSMAKVPEERYQQVDSMISDLQRLQALLEKRKAELNGEICATVDRLHKILREVGPDGEAILKQQIPKDDPELPDTILALIAVGESCQAPNLDYYRSMELRDAARKALDCLSTVAEARIREREARLKADVAALLDASREAFVAKDFRRCTEAADDILALEPTHTEAPDLKRKSALALKAARSKGRAAKNNRVVPSTPSKIKPGLPPTALASLPARSASFLQKPWIMAVGAIAVVLVCWQLYTGSNPVAPTKPLPNPDQAVGSQEDAGKPSAQSSTLAAAKLKSAAFLSEASRLRNQADSLPGLEKLSRLQAANTKINNSLSLDPTAEALSLKTEIEREILKSSGQMAEADRSRFLGDGLKRIGMEMTAGNFEDAGIDVNLLRMVSPNDPRVVEIEKQYGTLLHSPLAYRNWVGIKVRENAGQAAADPSLDMPKGGQIEEIAKGSPAEKAGLRVQDVITEVDGESVFSATGIPPRIGRKSPGERIDLKIWRERQTYAIAVFAGPIPESVKKEREAAAQEMMATRARRERLLACSAKYCAACEDPSIPFASLSGECIDCSLKFSKQIDACVNRGEASAQEMDQAKYLAKTNSGIDPVQSLLQAAVDPPAPAFVTIHGVELKPGTVSPGEQFDLLVFFTANTKGRVQFYYSILRGYEVVLNSKPESFEVEAGRRMTLKRRIEAVRELGSYAVQVRLMMNGTTTQEKTYLLIGR